MKIEYCTTTLEKANGLQHRSSLSPDSVLLFTAIGSNQTFHMRNVKFPIIITAIDKEGTVLEKSILRPEIDLFKTPTGTAHVVEASVDFGNHNKIEIGKKFPNLEIGEVHAKLRIRM